MDASTTSAGAATLDAADQQLVDASQRLAQVLAAAASPREVLGA